MRPLHVHSSVSTRKCPRAKATISGSLSLQCFRCNVTSFYFDASEVTRCGITTPSCLLNIWGSTTCSYYFAPASSEPRRFGFTVISLRGSPAPKHSIAGCTRINARSFESNCSDQSITSTAIPACASLINPTPFLRLLCRHPPIN